MSDQHQAGGNGAPAEGGPTSDAPTSGEQPSGGTMPVSKSGAPSASQPPAADPPAAEAAEPAKELTPLEQAEKRVKELEAKLATAEGEAKANHNKMLRV